MKRNRRMLTVAVASGVLAGAAAVAAAGSAASVDAGPARTEAHAAHQAVSPARAARIAEAWVERRRGPARVTGVEREDDFGGRWEVEVTLVSGAELDVHVDAVGRVIRVVAAGAVRPPGRSVDSARAARIAEAWVERRRGPARVTGVEREDDFGGRWEVEVTLRSGVEYDVHVAGDGRVVRVIPAGAG